MLFAWSVTEVIRYSYLALKLVGFEPAAFVWVRYSSYLILYPLGITSEMVQMWRASAWRSSRTSRSPRGTAMSQWYQ